MLKYLLAIKKKTKIEQRSKFNSFSIFEKKRAKMKMKKLNELKKKHQVEKISEIKFLFIFLKNAK